MATRLSRVGMAIGLLFLITLAIALPVSAQSASRSVTWQRFDVDLDLQRDGSVHVTETQAIAFNGTFQAGYRIVPLDRTTGATDVQVAEVVGSQPVPYAPGTELPNSVANAVELDGLHIDWWFSPTTNAVRTFLVHYTVTGAARIYDAGDQLQWRAIYADRPGAISSSTITVHLPADTDISAVKSAWYAYRPSGSFGALNPTATGVTLDSRTVRFSIDRLNPNVGAEVRVQFPHGLLTATPPPWQASADRADALAQTVAPVGTFLSLVLAIAILVGGGAFVFWLWFTNGRDPAVGAMPLRLEQPPSDLPAPVAGTLVDEVASEREVVAALVDMADRGLLDVTDVHDAQLVGTSTDVRINLRVALDDVRLRRYERALLGALFGASPAVPSEVLLSSAKQRFQTAIPSIDARLYEAVMDAGFFVRNPQTTRRIWYAVSITVIALGIALAVGASVWLIDVVPIVFLPGTALLFIGIVLAVFAGSMPRRTREGALEASKWRAFRAYLAQSAHSQRPASSLPAHYLPYAVAFGIDTAFVRHLEQVGTPPPAWYGRYPGPGGVVFVPGGWYRGPGYGRPGQSGGGPQSPGGSSSGGVAAPPVPNPQGWSDALADLLNAASQAMAHGGGSGGWSGGGFGGGGGGGGGSGGFR